MKTFDLAKTHKGEFYGSIAFAEMDGGYGEYKHTNKTTGEITWEVVQRKPEGGYRVRVMSAAEYDNNRQR